MHTCCFQSNQPQPPEQNYHASTVNAGPSYFAYVMIISQPSSHASPGGCGGAENSFVLKISTTQNEALSTIVAFFGTTGNMFTN